VTPKTYAEVARDGARALTSAGFAPEDSLREVHVLARARLGWDQATWLVRKHDTASAGFAGDLEPWVARRATHEPVAYITGSREFFGRDFSITADVLVPRPETELLVEAAVEWLADRRRPAHAARAHAPAEILDLVDVIDVGTGSGCLAVTLALECAHARVLATDVSAAALAVAARNAALWSVDPRITFVQQRLTASLVDAADLVVANPPYVAEADRAMLPPDVDFEPDVALFGGRDGLDVIRGLIPAAARALRPGGRFLCEIGQGQAEAVVGLIADAGLLWRETRPDLAGIARVVIADRPERTL
jgi:release factor glutamine methyltransferase